MQNWIKPVSLIVLCWTQAVYAGDETLEARLSKMPTEIWLNGRDLHIINLYKLQAQALLETTGKSEQEMVDRLVELVYTPYKTFFDSTYNGDERTFRVLATMYTLKQDPPITVQIVGLLDTDVNAIFHRGAAGMISATSLRPEGSWVFFWGH